MVVVWYARLGRRGIRHFDMLSSGIQKAEVRLWSFPCRKVLSRHLPRPSPPPPRLITMYRTASPSQPPTGLDSGQAFTSLSHTIRRHAGHKSCRRIFLLTTQRRHCFVNSTSWTFPTVLIIVSSALPLLFHQSHIAFVFSRSPPR